MQISETENDFTPPQFPVVTGKSWTSVEVQEWINRVWPKPSITPDQASFIAQHFLPPEVTFIPPWVLSAIQSAGREPHVSPLEEAPHVAPNLIEELGVNEQAAAKQRIAALPELESAGGAAYSFYRLAMTAIDDQEGHPERVSWSSVEQLTIRSSIAEHGRPAKEVADVLCKLSPGAVTPALQQALRESIERVETELAQVFASAQERNYGRRAGDI